MPKILTDNAQASIDTQFGKEPITIVGICWNKDAKEFYYSDRTLNGVEGRIMNLGTLLQTLNISENTTSSNATVTLNDTDGTLKAIMDTNDVHQAPCKIYQTFAGDAVEDYIIMFSGVIATPIIWSEGERSINLTIESILEDKEVGFAPEAGQLSFVPLELAGRPWPLVFGTCLNVPATMIRSMPVGQLKEQFGRPDPILQYKYTKMLEQEEIYLAGLDGLLSYDGYAQAIAPSAKDVLDTFLGLISENRRLALSLFAKTLVYRDLEKDIQDAQGDSNKVANLSRQKGQLESDMQSLSVQLDVNSAKKRIIEQQIIQLIQYEHTVRNEIIQQVNQLLQSIFDLQQDLIIVQDTLIRQSVFAKTTVQVRDGYLFPQNKLLTLTINGLVYTGIFSDDTLTIKAGPLPRYKNLKIAAREDNRVEHFWIDDATVSLKDMFCLIPGGNVIHVSDQYLKRCTLDLVDAPTNPVTADNLPNYNINPYQLISLDNYVRGRLGSLILSQEEINTIMQLGQLEVAEENITFPTGIFPGQKYDVTGLDITSILEASPMVLDSWLGQLKPFALWNLQTTDAWFCDVGSEVKMIDNTEVWYCANILETDVICVSAEKNIKGVTVLTTVPSEYYTVESVDLGPQPGGAPTYTATFIKLHRPLTDYNDNWLNTNIYVSQTSSVGPNTVDIIQWAIEKYTTANFDSTSFTYVKSKLANYPMNFAMIATKDLVTFIEELAWQARCAIYWRNNKYYIVYLSETPQSVVKDLTLTDVVSGTMQVSTTRTEDLVTKVVATYRDNYYYEDQITLTFRRNISKYGTKQQSYDFYAYTNGSLVRKSATFWLLRNANTFKIVDFDTVLNNLDLDLFDAVSFDSNNLVSNGAVTCLVKDANYDSSQNKIHIQLWVPVILGTMDEYTYAWPSSLSETVIYPPREDVIAGNAGSGAPNSSVSFNGTQIPQLQFSQSPNDFGQVYLSDLSDVFPALPTSNLPVVPNRPPANQNPQLPLVPVNIVNYRSGTAQPVDKDDRTVWMGQIVEKVDAANFKVLLDDGRYVTAIQMKQYNQDIMLIGTPTVVVRQNNTYLMQAERFNPWHRIVKILEVDSSFDFLKCEDVLDKTEIRVSVPYILARSAYQDTYRIDPNYQADLFESKRFDASSYFMKITRNTDTDAKSYSIIDPIYAKDQYILAARLFYSDSNETYWVDSNVQGRNWRPYDILQCKVKEDTTYTEEGFVTNNTKTVTCQVVYPTQIAALPEDDKTMEVEFYEPLIQYVFKKDTLVTCQYMGLHRYKVDRHLNIARIIDFTLDDDLSPLSGVANVTVDDYEDGLNPEVITDIVVKNKHGWSSDKGQKGRAERNNDGTYTITVLQCPSS